MLRRGVVPALVLLLVAQIGIRQWQERRQVPLTGLYPGEPVPLLEVAKVGGTPVGSLAEILTAKSSCSLLVVFSPGCPICQRMRLTWRERYRSWVAEVGAAVTHVWLSVYPDSLVGPFVANYDLDAVVLRVSSGEAAAAYADLGIIGTPTSYLIDPRGRVQMGLLGDVLPPADAAKRVCKDAA